MRKSSILIFTFSILFLTFTFQSLLEQKRGEKFYFTTYVVKVIDGDTLKTRNGVIRLSLIDAPDKNEKGYEKAKKFVENLCLNREIVVDIDDFQVKDNYGRWVAKVYCEGKNLNEELIENGLAKIIKNFCSKSEFANEKWTGCY